MNGVEFEDGELVIYESAPDHVIEFFEDGGEFAEALFNFAVVADQSDIEDPKSHKAREYAEDYRERVFDAVDNGDIEAAQEHLQMARLFESADDRILDAI